MKASIAPKHSFQILFTSLVTLILAPTIIPFSDHYLIKISLALVLISSLYLITKNKWVLSIGTIFTIIASLISWDSDLTYSSYSQITSTTFYLTFFSFICFYLLRFLIQSKQASNETIYAAMCLYIFISYIWMFIYTLIFITTPNAFTFNEHLAIKPNSNYADTLEIFSYYSFVTLTTLGYGDISPTHPLARAWVSVEAVIGQFYIAIVLAKLVGLATSAQSTENKNSK